MKHCAMRTMEGLESDGDWAEVQAPGVQLGTVALAGGPQLLGPITTGLENNKRKGKKWEFKTRCVKRRARRILGGSGCPEMGGA